LEVPKIGFGAPLPSFSLAERKGGLGIPWKLCLSPSPLSTLSALLLVRRILALQDLTIRVVQFVMRSKALTRHMGYLWGCCSSRRLLIRRSIPFLWWVPLCCAGLLPCLALCTGPRGCANGTSTKAQLTLGGAHAHDHRHV
jgi:hypothetical protein